MKLLLALILAITLNIGFAETISTVSEKAALIDNLAKNQAGGLEKINESQKNGTYNDNNYIVVIKKNGNSYERVAHFKEDKIGKEVENSLLEVINNAEKALANTNGPIAFNFSASEKKSYAVISKVRDLLIFNICSSQEEVDAYLKKTSALTTTEEKKPDQPETAAAPAEEKKPGQPEVKKDEKTIDTKKESDASPKAQEPQPK